MSQVKVSGNASGTGVLTIAAPNTNTDYTLTLPAETGTVLTSGGAIDVNASAPADSVAIDSSGNVGIGTTSPSGKLHVVGNETYFQRPGDTVYLRINTANGAADLDAIGGVMRFRTDTTERMRIDANGNLLVGKTNNEGTSGGSIGFGQGSGRGGLSSVYGNVANGGTLDISLNTGGGGWMGILMVSGSNASSAAQATRRVFAVMGRGTSCTFTQIGTQDGSTSGWSFAMSCPSNGVMRVTNNGGAAGDYYMTFYGGFGG